jgi:hypothetical protein
LAHRQGLPVAASITFFAADPTPVALRTAATVSPAPSGWFPPREMQPPHVPRLGLPPKRDSAQQPPAGVPQSDQYRQSDRGSTSLLFLLNMMFLAS